MAHSNSNSDAHRKSVSGWLSLSFEWRIPVYQRHYAWDAKDPAGPVHLFWETLREKTVSQLEGETLTAHYLGAIIVDNKTEQGAVDGVNRYNVVDGQQRLTTIQIALLALVRVAKQHDCSSEIKESLKKYIFIDEDANEPKNPRLRPSNFDIRQFQSVLNDAYDVVWNFGDRNVSRQNANKSKIVETSDFFEREFSSLISENSQHKSKDVIYAIMKTFLEGVDLVLIVLCESDNAQGVF